MDWKEILWICNYYWNFITIGTCYPPVVGVIPQYPKNKKVKNKLLRRKIKRSNG